MKKKIGILFWVLIAFMWKGYTEARGVSYVDGADFLTVVSIPEGIKQTRNFALEHIVLETSRIFISPEGSKPIDPIELEEDDSYTLYKLLSSVQYTILQFSGFHYSSKVYHEVWDEFLQKDSHPVLFLELRTFRI